MKLDAKILVVDDEEDILLTLKMLLKKHISTVICESNPYHIPRRLRTIEPDLVLLDMNYRRGVTSGEEGLEWLEKIKELVPSTEVIIITAHGDVEIAVKALKKGAIDFVEKPWHNDKLLATIQSALRVSLSEKKVNTLTKVNQGLSQALNASTDEFISESAAMKEINGIIDKVSRTDAHVLILGENGTGKEVVARQIHQKSSRSQNAFVKVDLGSIPDTLIESELFGHKQGAFTDAHTDRVGRFESATGGTLFLDEIGNLSPSSQSKLLSVLQNLEIIPLGSSQPVKIDVRLISATNMPLHALVKENSFRQDLLYRINTVEIKLPPLRKRLDDLPTLANHFLDMYKKKYQRPSLKLPPQALNRLLRHSWPGNIRELRHTIERGVIMAEGSEIRFGNIAADQSVELMDASPDSLNLEEMEKKLIVRALHVNQGNISRAAQDLGLTRAALYRRMEKYSL